MSTSVVDRLKAIFETMGLASEQIGEVVMLSDSKLRFNIQIYQDEETHNFLMSLHFCGPQTAYTTHSVCMASSEADVEKATEVLFKRFCSAQIPVILESLTDAISQQQCDQDIWSKQQKNFRVTIGNLNLFGWDQDVDLDAMRVHIDRMKQWLCFDKPEVCSPIFCFDTTLCTFEGAVTLSDLQINGQLELELGAALRNSYQPKANAGFAIVRHLVIAKRSAGPVRDARLRLTEAVLAWCEGERTSIDLKLQLKARDFDEFEAVALAVLVPETLAMAWLKQKALASVTFRVSDRFNQSYTLEPEKHPVFRLALDFAAEAFKSQAMLDFHHEYYPLASMSAIMHSATQALEHSADLSDSVMAIALLAPSAEAFGFGIEPAALPPSPAKPKSWWKRWRS